MAMLQDLARDLFWAAAFCLPIVALLVHAVHQRWAKRPGSITHGSRRASSGVRTPDRRARALVQMQPKKLQPPVPVEETQQVRVRSASTGQEGWIRVLPSTPCGAVLQQAQVALGQQVSTLEADGKPLDVSKPLGLVESGHVLVAHPDAASHALDADQCPSTASRAPKAIMEFGYHEYVSEVCHFCHRFHVVLKCPQALAEATKDNVIAKFEPKEFSVTIRGKEEYRLRRTLGPKTSLPVTFKVCPERCSLIVSPGKKVELVLRPALPQSFLPGKRVKLSNLQSKDGQRLNGHLGTLQSYIDGDANAVRYLVHMDDGEKLRVRPNNLVLVS